MKKKHKMTVGVLLIVGAIAYLLISGFGGNTGVQVTLSDLVGKGETFDGKYLLAEGSVVPDSIHWDGKKVELRFEITDGTVKVPVIYHDVPPDNMDHPDTEVILRGYYDNEQGVFQAEKVETRCPSKYEAAE
ncbi:MAG TPA: cytochrome c maturation protein CcmE [Clostridia bacterium]|nr:cytochrome c maturation protein CcmE [Clostridia bacterium]